MITGLCTLQIALSMVFDSSSVLPPLGHITSIGLDLILCYKLESCHL